MSDKLERFSEAYLLMGERARYRPQAPSDGFGNICLSRDELNDTSRLMKEARDYALAFDAEEDTRQFHIGCSNFTTNRAFVWSIEAARQLAAGGDGDQPALKLLEMATAEVRAAMETGR